MVLHHINIREFKIIFELHLPRNIFLGSVLNILA